MALDLSFLDHPSFGASYAFDDAAHDDATPLSPEAPGGPDWEFSKALQAQAQPTSLAAPTLRIQADARGAGRGMTRSPLSPPARSPTVADSSSAVSPTMAHDSWQAELALYEEALLAEAAATPSLARSPARRAPAVQAVPGMTLNDRVAAARRPLEQQPRTLQRQQLPEAGGTGVEPPPCSFVVGDDGAEAPAAALPRVVARSASAGAFRQGASMVDKRTARLMHATSFRAALEEQRSILRQERLSACTGAPPIARRASSTAGAVASFVRKRPLLPAEEAKGDYDALSVEVSVERDATGASGPTGNAPGCVVAHACMMKPDLVRMFVRHTAFVPSGGAMDEHAGADEVYGLAAAPLIEHAMRGGHSTLFTYGQTGSGKTFTLEQIFSRATPELAGRASCGARGSAYALRVSAVEVIGRRCVDLISRCDCQVSVRATSDDARRHTGNLRLCAASKASQAHEGSACTDHPSCVCREHVPIGTAPRQLDVPVLPDPPLLCAAHPPLPLAPHPSFPLQPTRPSPHAPAPPPLTRRHRLGYFRCSPPPMAVSSSRAPCLRPSPRKPSSRSCSRASLPRAPPKPPPATRHRHGPT